MTCFLASRPATVFQEKYRNKEGQIQYHDRQYQVLEPKRAIKQRRDILEYGLIGVF